MATDLAGARQAAEQGDEADEAFGGTNPRAASGAQPEVPPHARAAAAARGHRFAAYPRCSTDVWRSRAHGRPRRSTAHGHGTVPQVVVPQLVVERCRMTRSTDTGRCNASSCHVRVRNGEAGPACFIKVGREVWVGAWRFRSRGRGKLTFVPTRGCSALGSLRAAIASAANVVALPCLASGVAFAGSTMRAGQMKANGEGQSEGRRRTRG